MILLQNSFNSNIGDRLWRPMCHRDTGHQGRDHTYSLLRERFWWPSMHTQMTLMLKGCYTVDGRGGTGPKASIGQHLYGHPTNGPGTCRFHGYGDYSLHENSPCGTKGSGSGRSLFALRTSLQN